MHLLQWIQQKLGGVDWENVQVHSSVDWDHVWVHTGVNWDYIRVRTTSVDRDDVWAHGGVDWEDIRVHSGSDVEVHSDSGDDGECVPMHSDSDVRVRRDSGVDKHDCFEEHSKVNVHSGANTSGLDWERPSTLADAVYGVEVSPSPSDIDWDDDWVWDDVQVHSGVNWNDVQVCDVWRCPESMD